MAQRVPVIHMGNTVLNLNCFRPQEGPGFFFFANSVPAKPNAHGWNVQCPFAVPYLFSVSGRSMFRTSCARSGTLTNPTAWGQVNAAAKPAIQHGLGIRFGVGGSKDGFVDLVLTE